MHQTTKIRNLHFFKKENITVQVKEASEWQNSANCIVVLDIDIYVTAKINKNTAHENDLCVYGEQANPIVVYKQAMEVHSVSVHLCNPNPF